MNNKEPDGKKISVNLNSEEAKILEKYRQQTGKSYNDVIIELVRKL